VRLALRWLAGSLAAVAVLTAAFAVKGDGQPAPAPSQSTSSPQPPIEHLLVQVSDDQGRIIDNAIVTFTGSAVEVVTIDSMLACDFGQVGLQTVNAAGPIVAMSDMQRTIELNTGLRIDATISLQRMALAGMVDAVGGITVDTEAGRRLLPGALAAEYAVIRSPLEPESARMARFTAVLAAVMSALPRDVQEATDVISALGSTAHSTVPTATVAQFLVTISDKWRQAKIATVPVVPSDLGPQWQRLDVDNALPQTIDSSSIRVVVQGGLAAQRLTIRDALREWGAVFIDGGNEGALTTVTLDASLSSFATRDFVQALDLDVTTPATSVPNLFGDVLVTLAPKETP
jgi:hypothetical protein